MKKCDHIVKLLKDSEMYINKLSLTKFDKAAIIGYWRNGMKMEEIAAIVNIPSFEVEAILIQYFHR